MEHFKDNIDVQKTGLPIDATGCYEPDKRSPRDDYLYNILSACIAGFMGRLANNCLLRVPRIDSISRFLDSIFNCHTEPSESLDQYSSEARAGKEAF